MRLFRYLKTKLVAITATLALCLLILAISPTAQSGVYYVTGLTITPTADGNLTLVRTSTGAQLFNVQSLTKIAGIISGAWGTGNTTGSILYAGRNTSGSGAASALRLDQRDGTAKYIWVDADGDIRLGNAPPQEDNNPSDTSGVVVGSVTSGEGGSIYDFDVEGFGALCDGTTNDATAIQDAIDAAAAVDAGTVVFPPRTCRINTGLIVGNGDCGGDGSCFISLRGQSEVSSKISYYGSTSGVALSFLQNKYFRVEKLNIDNGVAKGTTTGIKLDGTGTTGGTMTHVATFDHVIVDGFDIGIAAGSWAGEAASEILYTNVTLTGNDTGWVDGGYNSLNHMFKMVHTGNNAVVGIDMTAGNVYVDGGSSYGNAIDFRSSNAGATREIKNFRSESAGAFVYATATQLGSLVVANNMVTGMTDGDIAIEVVAGIYPIVIRGNSLATSLTEGYSIKLRGGGDGGGPVVLEDNILLGDETNNLPFFIESGTPGGGAGTTDYNRKLRVSAHRNRRHTVDWYQETQYYDDIDGAVLTYVNTIIPQVRTSWETPTKYLPRRRENLLTLGQNTRAQGNNLRVPAKFATSSTVAVTFQRTITITSPGSGSEVGTRAWTVNSGAVYESDLGRIIGITNSGVHYVYITKILSSTSFETAGADDTSGSSLSATIGENEPDDDYMVFPSCNANETISWSSLTTSGFTLTSSNGSSTATCHVLILR